MKNYRLLFVVFSFSFLSFLYTNCAKKFDTSDPVGLSSDPIPGNGSIDISPIFGKVAIGNYNACYLKQGEVYCIGFNDSGQLGIEQDEIIHTTFVKVNGIENLTQITIGSSFICGLLSDQTVKCWGSNESGFLGNGKNGYAQSSSTPVAVVELTGVKNIVSGFYHTCALLNDQTVKCWGYNYYGQAGAASTDYKVDKPVVMPNLTDVKQLAAGENHTCALLNSGAVKCWGYNNDHQSSSIQNADSKVYAPGNLIDISQVVKIVSGKDFNCALIQDATVKCWGNSYARGFASYDTNDKYLVSSVPNLNNVKDIYAGSQHICALLFDKSLKCWGNNDRQQLGFGFSVDRTINDFVVPTKKIEIDSVEDVVMGSFNSCARLSNGKIVCWGYNSEEYGNLLADMVGETVYTPHEALLVPAAQKLFLASDHSCVLTLDNKYKCWGLNQNGELGVGHRLLTSKPTEFNFNYSGVLDFASGISFSCMLNADRTISCWGHNSGIYDPILAGDENSKSSLIPQKVSGISSVKNINIKFSTICALKMDNTVSCWGDNINSQAGVGLVGNYLNNTVINTPTDIGLSNIKTVRMGFYHNCAVTIANKVYCWGDNRSYQLGDTSSTQAKPSPYLVTAMQNDSVIDVALSREATCALLADKTAKCWGKNSSRGDNSNTSGIKPPSAVYGLTDVKKIEAGYDYFCALKNNGTVYCWGYAYNGGLGNILTDYNVYKPTKVENLDNVVDLTIGEKHACALKNDGKSFCWGKNYLGMLGIVDIYRVVEIF